jgi:dephospho-CoA kinase
MDVVARMAEEQIRAALSRNRAVVIDGLYSFAEYGFLKSIFGPELVLIALHAARETRYARLALRPERPLSRPEVDARDLHEIQYLEKAPPIVLADYHILNNSSIEELQGALEVVLQSAR